MKSKDSLKKTSIALLLLAMVATLAGSASADQVILNPDGVGDTTALALVHGGILPVELRTNWGVNTTDDGDTSYVWNKGAAYNTDLYALEDVSLAGTITSVTVYIKARAEGTATQESASTAIKIGDTVALCVPVTLGTTYTTYATTYYTKPGTADAWTWSDINALQAGVSLRRAKGAPGALDSRCTKVWVVVDYTECEWIGETAWAAGDRYNEEQGNWATYTPYDADSTVILYAGQTMEAGTVQFSEPDGDGDVTITITLNSGWRFEDVAENVKIQDYDVAPSSHPSPGLFDHKGDASGSPFSIVVPGNYFYGVHVDVEWEDCG